MIWKGRKEVCGKSISIIFEGDTVLSVYFKSNTVNLYHNQWGEWRDRNCKWKTEDLYREKVVKSHIAVLSKPALHFMSFCHCCIENTYIWTSGFLKNFLWFPIIASLPPRNYRFHTRLWRFYSKRLACSKGKPLPGALSFFLPLSSASSFSGLRASSFLSYLFLNVTFLWWFFSFCLS